MTLGSTADDFFTKSLLGDARYCCSAPAHPLSPLAHGRQDINRAERQETAQTEQTEQQMADMR